MLRILEVTFPFFALVGLGYAAVRRGLLPLDAVPGLNVFVLFFALPCMLFRFAAATPVSRLFDPAVFGTWLLCAALLSALGLLLQRRRGASWNDAAFGTLVAVFSNSGFMGVPLLVDLLGPRAAAPAIVTLVIDMVLTTSLCVALSRLDGAGSRGARHAVGQALRGMARNPLGWAIVVGCLASAAGLVLPPLLMRPLGLLADAASPAALFTLGAMLARPRVSTSPRPRHDPTAILVGLKLLVHPLLVAAAGRLALALGAPLDPFALLVLTLVAALPAAGNVPMLAERFGADSGRVARVVLVSTTLAFASFTAVVALLV